MKRLFIFLAIAVFVLAGCGGDSDADNSGSESENQTDTAASAEAVEKGVLEYNQAVEDEITGESEMHRYTFTGATGDEIVVRIQAADFSAFTAPYAFLYGPDGELIGNSDTSTSSRSSRVSHTLEADGEYVVIVQPFEDRGIEKYEVKVEKSN